MGGTELFWSALVLEIELRFGQIWAVWKEFRGHFLWKGQWDVGKSGRYGASFECTLSWDWGNLGGMAGPWMEKDPKAGRYSRILARIWAEMTATPPSPPPFQK